MDCTKEDSIAQAAQQVSASCSHLDLLLNVAGILHIPGKMSPGGTPNAGILNSVARCWSSTHHQCHLCR